MRDKRRRHHADQPIRGQNLRGDTLGMRWGQAQTRLDQVRQDRDEEAELEGVDKQTHHHGEDDEPARQAPARELSGVFRRGRHS